MHRRKTYRLIFHMQNALLEKRRCQCFVTATIVGHAGGMTCWIYLDIVDHQTKNCIATIDQNNHVGHDKNDLCSSAHYPWNIWNLKGIQKCLLSQGVKKSTGGTLGTPSVINLATAKNAAMLARCASCT